jgi:hypothetical protein
MGIEVTAPGAGGALDGTALGAGVALGVTELGAGVALEVATGPPAGVCPPAWQASRVTRHGVSAPIRNQVFAVLFIVTVSFARALPSRGQRLARPKTFGAW